MMMYLITCVVSLEPMIDHKVIQISHHIVLHGLFLVIRDKWISNSCKYW